MISMYAFIFSFSLACTEASNNNLCKDGAHINGVYHDREVLKIGVDRPYQLAVDRETNFLFFSYSVDSDLNDSFKSACVDLNNNSFFEITGIKNGFAATVHQGTVYLGGSDGIYKFDKETKTALMTEITKRDIWLLYSKGDLFFIVYPEQNLYEYKDGKARLVNSFENMNITQFAIDEAGHKFFYNDTGLYVIAKTSNVSMAKLLTEEIVIRGITLNEEGKAYFSGENGIYKYEGETLMHVYGSSDIFGMAFDNNNNIIYATRNKIIKLIPTKKNCKHNS